ncbi:MAG: hypothetical protein V3T22_12675 [Planctomycetota bacterium]
MSLRETLDAIRAGSAERIPAEAQLVMHHATDELRASGLLAGVAAVGDRMPEFDLKNHSGEPVRSAELLAAGPLVVTFFRGFW